MSEEPYGEITAHRFYLMRKGFAFKKAALAVKTSEDKSKGPVILLIVMVVMGFIGGIFGGVAITYHILQPPANYTGVCAPPLQIVHGGCFSVVSSTDSSGKVHTNYYPAGTVCSGNETISQCEKNG